MALETVLAVLMILPGDLWLLENCSGAAVPVNCGTDEYSVLGAWVPEQENMFSEKVPVSPCFHPVSPCFTRKSMFLLENVWL